MVFARIIPRCFIPKVKSINAIADAKTANSSKGIHASQENGVVIKSV